MVNKRTVSMDLAKKAGLATDRFPETQQEIAKAEDALAQELQKMSIEEQEKATFDVYGISHLELDEDPQMIEDALNRLELALQKIEKKQAYDEAKFLNETYVTSRDFRLLFLRGEDYDVDVCAKTIVYHFELKKELFGNGDVLAREVLQSDLDPIDKFFLEAGHCQVCPKRDACGRTIQIFFCDDPGEDENQLASIFRASWYMMMAALREEEAQKRGIVWICYNYVDFPFEFRFYRKFNQLDIAIPTRVAAGHYCYKTDSHDSKALGFQVFTNEHERFRMKLHKGTHEEIKFELQTYGISVEDLPAHADGTWSWKWHSEWLKALRAQEESHAPILSAVLIPKTCDVLFGKNARARDHVGNIRAHQLVEEYYEEYEAANKFQKTEIANRIISNIHGSGGRFLKQDEFGTWEAVEDTVARQKIAHWYRHLRSKKSKQSAPQSRPPASKRELADESPNHELDPSELALIKRVTPCSSPIDPSHGNPS